MFAVGWHCSDFTQDVVDRAIHGFQFSREAHGQWAKVVGDHWWEARLAAMPREERARCLVVLACFAAPCGWGRAPLFRSASAS
jgi:hypothetical protein